MVNALMCSPRTNTAGFTSLSACVMFIRRAMDKWLKQSGIEGLTSLRTRVADVTVAAAGRRGSFAPPCCPSCLGFDLPPFSPPAACCPPCAAPGTMSAALAWARLAAFSSFAFFFNSALVSFFSPGAADCWSLDWPLSCCCCCWSFLSFLSVFSGTWTAGRAAAAGPPVSVAMRPDVVVDVSRNRDKGVVIICEGGAIRGSV